MEDVTSEASPMNAEELERAWLEEAARRYQQLKAGTAKAIPADEVFAKLEARARRMTRAKLKIGGGGGS